MRYVLLSVVVAALAASAACATTFTGEPHYPGGAPACYANCQAQNLEMAAFVYSGEFATSCVCRPRSGPGPQASDTASDIAPAMAAVETARRAASQASQR
jgi:hypothetical protein